MLQQEKFTLNIRILFFHSEGGETVEQAAQRLCRASVFGDTQKLAGESPQLPAVTFALTGDWTR